MSVLARLAPATVGLLVLVAVSLGTVVADGESSEAAPAEQPDGTPGRVDERAPAFSPSAPRREKLDGPLAAVAEAAAAGGDDLALTAAGTAGLPIISGQIRVLVESVSLDLMPAHAAVVAAGGTVEGEYADTIQALMSPSSLDGLAASPDVRYIRAPAGRAPDGAPVPSRGR